MTCLDFTPVFLDLCYQQGIDVVAYVCKLLQLSVSPLQTINLLLQLLNEFFSLALYNLFLISDHLRDLKAVSLNEADELSKDPLSVLHCCLCRVL